MNDGLSNVERDIEAENDALGEEIEQAHDRYYAMRDDRDRLQVLADVRARQLAGAVAERDVFARALRLAIGSADYRESFIQHAKRQLAAERGQ